MLKVLCLLLLAVLAFGQYNETIGKILGRLTIASYCKPHLIETWTC
jgi:hypothetical protein